MTVPLSRIVACIAVLGIVWTAAIAGAIKASDEARLSGIGERAVLYRSGPQTDIALADWQRAVVRTPLSADVVNGFIVATATAAKVDKLSAAQMRVLTGLGWQSSRIQQNLILEAYRLGDDRLLLDRVDGMLRRQKLTANILPFLFLLEQSGTATRDLVRRNLRDNPSWRRIFLVEAAGYSTPEGVEARGQTLRGMFVDGLKPTREEVAPIVARLREKGNLTGAVDLWMRYRGISGTPPTPFDPHFGIGAQDNNDQSALQMPFEWQVEHGPGFSARLRSEGKTNGTMTIRWDGRNAPVFARQVVLAAPGKYDIIITGRLLSHEAMQRILFVADCPTAKAYYRSFSVERDSVFRFNSDDAIVCNAPDLRIVGVAGDGADAVELELTKIQLMKAESPMLARKLAR